MTKRILCALLACALLLPLTGCLKFRNSMDLNVPVTNAYIALTTDPGETSQFGTPDEPTAAQPDTQATLPGEEASSQPGPGAENNTTAPAGSDPAATTAPAAQAGTDDLAGYLRTISGNEYDILRTNNCSLKATFDDGKEISNVEMAMGDKQVYIASEMDGLKIGLYVKDKKTFIYLPDQKKYLKLNSVIAGMMGMDPDEFTNAVAEFGFDTLPPLSSAKNMADGKFGGTACKIFTLVSDDNTQVLHVYLSGKKLLAIEYCDANGQPTSTMKFQSISAGFPQMPPAGFSEIGYVEFGKILMATAN